MESNQGTIYHKFNNWKLGLTLRSSENNNFFIFLRYVRYVIIIYFV